MPVIDPDVSKIQDILQANSHLNFIQRIMERDKYPVLDNGDGTHSTHLMADTEVDGKYISYPTIIHNQKNNTLQQLGMDQAIHHALNTGEYVEFKTPEEASWFSENYKKVWGDPDKW